MITLRHATKIAAPRGTVYRALTDLGEMAEWHAGDVSGAMALGEVLVLTPKPGQRFAWRTEQLEPDTAIVQTAIEGSGTSPGRTLSFLLSDGDDGRTVVELNDGPWQEGDPHLAFCNTQWGGVLRRLKDHAEQRSA